MFVAMVMKRVFSLLLGLLLIGSLFGLAGCGPSQRAGVALTTTRAISVQIALDTSQAAPDKPVVTLTDSHLAQQLYTTINALPPMPAQIACTDELGPQYTLTFRQGIATLMTAVAKRYGCHPVTIAGASQDRQGTQAFWSQLDSAIYAATPPAHPTGLAIEHTPDPAQTPLTARIPSAEVAQRLYNAILALPWRPWATACVDTAPIPEYQLVFQTTDRPVPAIIHSACGTIELDGNYHTRGGWYVMDSQFQQLFQQIIGGATFAPASPDHLTITVAQMRGSSRQVTVTDPDVMRRLYQETFSLQPTPRGPNCPSDADKVAGTGVWYTLNFSQWGLPILQLDAYKGNCASVAFSLTQRAVQSDQTFWNLVQQAAG